jgi:hypothetical protein
MSEDLGLGSTLAAVLSQRPNSIVPVGAIEAKKRKEQKDAERKHRLEKKLLREKERVIPDAATDIQRERALVKVATRGVVMLFNAIAQQQEKRKNAEAAEQDEQDEEDELQSSKKKKVRSDEMSRKEFLDRLKSSSSTATESSKNSSGKDWEVFNDEFVHELAHENELEEEANY